MTITSEEFHRGYNKLIDLYGLPDPIDAEHNRRVIAEWDDMTRNWSTNLFHQAISQLIQTRQYRSFPQPGDLNSIYNALIRSEHRSTDEPPQHHYRAQIDLEIEQIEDAIRAMTPEDRTAFLTRVNDIMAYKLSQIEPVIDSPSTRKNTLQPAIYSIFTGTNSPFLQFETRMQAVQLYAQDHNITLSQPIRSIFDTHLPHRLSDEEINSRTMDTEEIDRELNASYEEILALWKTHQTLTNKRRHIIETHQYPKKHHYRSQH